MTSSHKPKPLIKILLALSVTLSILFLFQFFSDAAETTDTTINDLTVTPTYRNLNDNNVTTFSSINSLTLQSNSVIDSVYIIFWNETTKLTLTCGEKTFDFETSFLHTLIEIPEDVTDCKQVTINFENKVNVSDVYAFTDGTLPDWVQLWNAPYEKADLLLNTTHADDEQLFFAGVLPYHSAKGYRVQVVYFTDHKNAPGRRHELLNGLWSVGIDHYPIISNFPDAYSESSGAALNNLANAGFTEDDVIAFQTEILRRFKPQVVIGHDLNGEYGHGQHILNAETLTKAVQLAASAENYPDSAEKYGIWETPKLYLHLYEENKITLNWDEPLEAFGGKSAFQMTQQGFTYHNSQRWTWFYTWLNGTNGSITAASQIRTYSPCNYGLYRTTVGEDVLKNSFFENIVSYDEQERLEQERLEQERLEQQKKEEEESKRIEEESKRLESEAQASREASAAEASRLEIEEQKAEANAENSKIKGIIAIIILVTAVVSLGIVIVKKYR